MAARRRREAGDAPPRGRRRPGLGLILGGGVANASLLPMQLVTR
ncbi:hypothetical protein [Nonomuraea sp. NPDC049504]